MQNGPAFEEDRPVCRTMRLEAPVAQAAGQLRRRRIQTDQNGACDDEDRRKETLLDVLFLEEQGGHDYGKQDAEPLEARHVR